MHSHTDPVCRPVPSSTLSPIRSPRFGRVAQLFAAGALLLSPAAAYAQSACDADFDGNGEVNGADLTVMLVSWGACKGCSADIVRDGLVDGSDLASFLILWGEACVQDPVIKSIAPNTAPRWGGVDVYINGSNLPDMPNILVKFGTKSATVRSASGGAITVTAPPLDPGVFDITVSKSDGSGSTTVVGAFTVTATLAPDWATVVDELPDPKVVTDPAVLEAIQASGLPWRVLAGNNGLQGEPIPMVLVPSGTFFRGCTQPVAGTTCPNDALPALAIDMPAFYIGETEVTQQQFTSQGFPNTSWHQPPGEGSSANNPIEGYGLSGWVEPFLQSVGCRLPTEAEWEYAYRAGTQTAFFTGSDNRFLPPLPAWLCFNSSCLNSQQVKQLAPNGFGLYDMAGNVSERVSDWYSDTYYSEVGDGFNPQGPGSGVSKVVRGGSFRTVFSDEASAYQRALANVAWPEALGFRVARSVPSNAVLTGVFPPRGLSTGGGLVKITGQNLLAVTQVSFGYDPFNNFATATIISKKWGEIVVELPPWYSGSDQIDIFATVPGQIVTLPKSFAYADLSWATILDNQPDPAIVYQPQMHDKIAKSGLPARVRHNYTGVEMLLVPEGIFNMGCSASKEFACSEDELPVHPVTITEPFYLARYEWKNSEHPNGFFPQLTTPVTRYSWNDLAPILQVYGLRFPTEAEWEYAYRAGTTTAYHAASNGNPFYINGSNDESTKWLIGCLGFSIENPPQCGPGQQAPNGLGFFDMTGNVREFVADWYGPYAADAQFDPTGPAKGAQRVTRGGAWIEWYGRGRSSSRTPFNPDLVSDEGVFPTGVRPAKSWR
jgi:formylglycine-generating enzyme required for sulfatase activity